MQTFEIDYPEAFQELKQYVIQNNYKDFKCRAENSGYKISFEDHEEFFIPIRNDLWKDEEKKDIRAWVASFRDQTNLKRLIFGKDDTQNVVSCEITENQVELFIEENGQVFSKFLPHKYWIVSPKKLGPHWRQLEGGLYYRFIRIYDEAKEFYIDRKKFYREDIYCVSDPKEAAMILNGFTYFKGMKVGDVSALFFDIEATTLKHTNEAKVLLISNTFVKNGVITRKMFAYDDYETDTDFFNAWCDWVREVNPSIISGHNIYGYDLPYMNYCANVAGTELFLGRNGSPISFAKKASKFRKDGSQDYEYFKAFIYGREIVDTMFVSYHFDFSRKYVSYALKQIIKQENLEVEGRQFYDASTISKNYLIPEEWEKIKKYAEHDADDAYSLYKLMIAAYFYLNQSVPKSFQSINCSASGSQINSFLVRSYLQEGHSLPKASSEMPYEGAISLGNPGHYKNVFKIDVASLYPSIMIQYQVYDKVKDPLANFSKMVNYFTDQRLTNKKLAKETGDRYYKELQEAQKIIINSAYGMLGARGLLFNSPENASFVTRKGREILQTAIDWALANEFTIVNADTDSISIGFSDGYEFSEEVRKEILTQVNALYPEKIKFEDDGYYKVLLVLKAKNYVLYDGVKTKIKGSALRSSKTEKAFKEFMEEIIDCFIKNEENNILNIYHKYVKDIYNVKDISKWSKKVTITDKVLNPERTNEQNVLDALDGEEVQMGDKVFMFFTEDGSLCKQDNWTNNHDKKRLLGKLYNTLKIFTNVLDMTQFPKYHLKNKKVNEALQQVINAV